MRCDNIPVIETFLVIPHKEIDDGHGVRNCKNVQPAAPVQRVDL